MITLQEKLKKDREMAEEEMMQKEIYRIMAKEIIENCMLPMIQKAHDEERLKHVIKIHVIAYEQQFILGTEPYVLNKLKENKYPGNEVSNLPVWKKISEVGKEYGIQPENLEPIEALGGQIYGFYMEL